MFSDNPEIKRSNNKFLIICLTLSILLSIFLVFYILGGNKSDENKSDENKSGENKSEKIQLNTSLQGVLPQTILQKEGKKLGISVNCIENNGNYTLPGDQLSDNQTDAILSGHAPWLLSTKNHEDKWKNIVPIQPFYVANYSIWKHKNDNLSFPQKGQCNGKELKDLKVLIPDDPSNLTFALLLLEQKGFLDLQPGSYEKQFLDLNDVLDNNNKIKKNNIKCLNMQAVGQQFKDISNGTYNYDLAVSFPKLMPLTDNDIEKIKFQNEDDNDDSFLLEEPRFNVFSICLMSRKDNKYSEKINKLKDILKSNELIEHNNNNFKEHLTMVPFQKMSEIMHNIEQKYQFE